MICYQCGHTPCLYEGYRAGRCYLSPRPYTLATWAWNALYDASVADTGKGDLAGPAWRALVEDMG